MSLLIKRYYFSYREKTITNEIFYLDLEKDLGSKENFNNPSDICLPELKLSADVSVLTRQLTNLNKLAQRQIPVGLATEKGVVQCEDGLNKTYIRIRSLIILSET